MKTKKNKLYIVLSVLVVCIIGFVVVIKIDKRNTTILNQFNNRIIDGKFTDKFSFYYLKHKYFPSSMKEYMNWLDYKNKGERYFFDKNMTDLFSKSNRQLVYLPIYNRKTNVVDYYIILSVGEDGVLNNSLNEKLYSDNWFKKIKAYNIEETTHQLGKTTIFYPIFNKKTHRHINFVVLVDNKDLRSKKILLKGDTLFSDSLIYKNKQQIYGSENFRLRKESSIFRKLFGKKDYIVGFGRPVIVYKME